MQTQFRNDEFTKFVETLMEKYNAVGMAISVIDNGGLTKYEQYFGHRDKTNEIPIDEDTIFGLASVTKSFTCLSIMQLAEKHKLDYNSCVKEYLPSFQTEYPAKISHLMSHSAGFYPQSRIVLESIAEKMGVSDKDEDFAYSQGIAKEGARLVIERLCNQNEFTGPLGARFSYSNDGYAVLSELIRLCAEQDSYSEYLDKNIFEPLEMNRSGCGFNWLKEDPNVSKLYYMKNGNLVESTDFYENSFALMGGGGVKSTVKDMRKILEMYLNSGKTAEGKKLIDSFYIDEMMRPKILHGHQSFYGFGMSTKNIDDFTVYGHGGSLPGVSSHFLFSHDCGLGVVVLCNTSAVPVAVVAEEALRMVRGKNKPERKSIYKEIKWSEEFISRIVGTFRNGEGSEIVIFTDENGQLAAKVNNVLEKPVPVHKNIAIFKDEYSDRILKIYEEEDGRVDNIFHGSRILKRVHTL